MEMGEGLCKLRKIGFERGGPLFRFERDVSEVLEFVYHTQLELAACKSRFSFFFFFSLEK